jgi:cyclase
MISPYSKQRLIFSLYFNHGQYCLSRNFSLQKVGGVEWLIDKFQIEQVTDAIDELVILDVSETKSNLSLANDLRRLLPNFLIPVSVGGLIDSESQVKQLFDIGADRIIFNSAFLQESALPEWTVSQYGANAVIASLDFKKVDQVEGYQLFSKKLPEAKRLSIQQTLKKIEVLGVKEIIVGSVDHDGTGHGVDIDLHQFLLNQTGSKLIPSGGMDTEAQVINGFELCKTEAIVVSHLLNFMGGQLSKTRMAAIDAGINLAKWST